MSKEKTLFKNVAVVLLILGVVAGALAQTKISSADNTDWEWRGVALGAKIGTLGVGGELSVGVNPYFNLRAGGSWAAFSVNTKFEDVKYDLDLDLTVFPLLLDIHPFANNFRISGGVIFHERAQAELKATPDKSVTIGDHKYPASLIGTLSGSIESSHQVAPYIGIGFGNAVAPDTAWSFAFDLGVAIQSYDVALTADGPAMEFLGFLGDLQKERDKIQDDVDKFKVYPVLSFGVAYHF